MPAAALLGATGLLLTACDDRTEGQEAAPEPTQASQSSPDAETTVTVTETPADEGIDVDFDALQQVEPSRFRDGTMQSFIYEVDGTKGECFVGEGTVTCIGTAADDVPDLDMPPFTGRPGAVSIGRNGVAYTGVEGVPPAKTELETGHWVDFGDVKCAKPDDSTLACVSDEAAIRIAGADRDIDTEGPVVEPKELHARSASRPGTGDETGTDALVQAPTLCGATEGHRLADVVEGEITCEEAMAVLDEYEARRPSEGSGNIMWVEFDGWACSSPTAARSEELGAKTVCEHSGRGIRVQAPA